MSWVAARALRYRSASVIVVLLSLGAALSGCLGGDGDGDLAPSAAAGGSVVAIDDPPGEPMLFLDDQTFLLQPWRVTRPEPFAEPSLAGLVQVAGVLDGDVLLRLLYDGDSFVLMGRATSTAVGVHGTEVLARIIDVRDSTDLAANATRVTDRDFVLRLPAFDRVRMDAHYRVEVLWFQRNAPPVDVSPADADGVRDGGVGIMEVEQAFPGDSDVHGTTVLVWESAVPLRSRADVSFAGPGVGTDQADVLESEYVAGPKTGTYRVTVSGERIWMATLLMDFDDSVIHATSPEAFGNGSRTMDVFLTGHRPMDVWRYLPRDQGFDQNFVLKVEVDWETGEDVFEEGHQWFFATMQHGYRVLGQTLASDAVGADVQVRVKVE